MNRRFLSCVLLALASPFAFAQSAAPSDYPRQPIRLIVPFTVGSTSDITTRAVAQQISGPLGQPVIVENRPGANGGIGMQVVARAKPDGYTLVVGSVSSTVVPSVIQKNVPFDLLRDFTPVATIANTALVLTVPVDSPIHDVPQLVDTAKKAPNTLSYGNSAGLYQLAMESLKQQAGIDLLAVPYKGPAEAMNDLLAGRLTVNPDSLGSATHMIDAGRVRALAVMSRQRQSVLPEVPTLIELGYKDFEFNGWIGLLAPAGTPEPIIERLHREITQAVQSKEVRDLYRKLMLEPIALTPKQYRDAMASDLARYEQIARAAHIEKQ